MTRGRFITFEGGEGAGKSTQISLLADHLVRQGKAVTMTREPGGTPGAEAVRTLLLDPGNAGWDPLTEVLLHFAARREHLIRAIMPAVERGEWVLSDRFADSTLAYQGFGQGVDRAAIDSIYRIVVGAFAPDLTLILDLPAEEGLARVRARRAGGDRYETMDLDFHRRLRDGFLEIGRTAPDRCRIVDASGPVDDVAEKIWQIVRERFPDE